MKRLASLFACSWLLAACGGSDASTNANVAPQGDDTGVAGDDAAPVDDAAATPPPVDHGSVSDKYPAFTPDQPMLSSNGGPVLSAPVIVTVTWPGEPNADNFEKLGDKLGGTDYWSAIVSEYGVAPTTSGAPNHVRMTTALAASVNDADLQALVTKSLGDATSGWPAPTANSVYVLYLPTTTKLMTATGGGPGGGTTMSEACAAGIGGYHESVTVNGAPVAVAILPQCNFGQGLSAYENTTLSASHEIAEAATDPEPNDNPAYFGVDDNHLAYYSFMQFNVEDGDMCEIFRDSALKLPSGDLSGFYVQRQWSNKSAKAGHNPCVPAPSDPYFNVTPLDLTNVKVTFGTQTLTTKGVKIPVNGTGTVTLGFYSDAAAKAWTLSSFEGSLFALGPTGQSTTTNLSVSIDKTSGQNGEKAVATIKVLKAGRNNRELVTFVSRSSTGEHYMPIYVDSN
jgi:hypothetical protein